MNLLKFNFLKRLLFNSAKNHIKMNYSKKTCQELIKICKDLGIKGYSKKKKDEIIKLIKENDTINTPNVIDEKKCNTINRKEVQAHGFSWEKEILQNVFHITNEELENIKYNSKVDLPAKFNHLDNCDISIKTSCSKNTICMADCLRVFDIVNSNNPIHMIVIYYIQDDKNKTKKISNITEIDLTNSGELLFGNLTRVQIEELDTLVKSIPQKRKPTKEEHKKLYSLRDSLQVCSGSIYLNIKCNSTQSRLQCSFNNFQQFIQKNSTRVVAISNNNIFRGGTLSYEITSPRRCFKKKQN